MRERSRQCFSVSRNHESAGIIFMDIYKEMSIEKMSNETCAASLQSFQLQFEFIVLAVLLASSSEQHCPSERAHFLCQAKSCLISSLLWMHPNKCHQETNAATVVILSLTVQINLPLTLQTDNFFVSGQTYKISRGSNTFFPHCIKLNGYQTIRFQMKLYTSLHSHIKSDTLCKGKLSKQMTSRLNHCLK